MGLNASEYCAIQYIHKYCIVQYMYMRNGFFFFSHYIMNVFLRKLVHKYLYVSSIKKNQFFSLVTRVTRRRRFESVAIKIKILIFFVIC